MDSLHARKVMRPTISPTILPRERLVNRLNEVIVGDPSVTADIRPAKLVLLQAPAGYGKTTLLADFARHTTLPCCWYTLDRADTDTLTFLNTLLASIRTHFPGFGAALDPLLADARAAAHHYEVLITALIETLATEITKRFVLLVCNVHEINGCQSIIHLLNQLLRHSSSCVLVLESRSIPDLDFATLLARRELVVINHDLLRLSAQEIRTLAALQGISTLSAAEAEQMAMAFDGWMVGILLGTRLGDARFLRRSAGLAPDGISAGPHIDRQHLFAYVVNEVFRRYPAEYAFLKEACILEEMTPALCAALLELPIEQVSHLLASLEESGLFVKQQAEDAQGSWTCHPALRDLLAEELHHRSPERFAQLHQRSAELLNAAHNYRQAIYHALEAGDNERAAHLILENAEPMTDQGHAESLARWIDAFPTTMTGCYPKLLLIRARIYLFLGNAHAALPLLDAADAAVETLTGQALTPDLQNLPILQAEIGLARSRALFVQLEYKQSQSLCKQVLANLPADEVGLRAETYMRIGFCYHLLGDFTAGTEHIQKALQLWGRHTIRRQPADGHSVLAQTYSHQGNFALAEHHMARALACWEHLQDSWGKIENLIRWGNIKARQGAIPEAENILQEALASASALINYQRGQAYALSSLGTCYLLQERYEHALKVTEEALALARQLHDQFLLTDVLCDLAMIYLYLGDTATAMILISEVEVQTASGESIGYKCTIRDLIYGTIYLYQQQYSKAWPYLSESEATLGKIGIKQVHLQALLRLAAYHLAQDRVPDAVHLLKKAVPILPICEGYKQLAQTEVSHFPDLQQAIKNLPELAQLRALLYREPEIEATPVQEQPPPAQEILSVTTPEVAVVAPRLTIRALGEPVVLLDLEPVTRWRMARAMELFFYLLDCGRPMRKEQLLTALWPEVDEQTDHTLHSTIYYVRKALGESCIISRKGTYALNLAACYGDQVEYDVVSFQKASTQAKQALAQNEPAVAQTALLSMVECYRGDYVEPFYNEWCRFRRDALRQAYLEARSQLAQLAWQREQWEESAQHWQQLLAVDGCQEEAHYGLMRCYLNQDKRGLALRQYQRCRETLQHELGVQPGPAIQQLYQSLVTSSAH